MKPSFGDVLFAEKATRRSLIISEFKLVRQANASDFGIHRRKCRWRGYKNCRPIWRKERSVRHSIFPVLFDIA